ncbi:MAG: hypothetical protein RLZZ243_952 [Bacteroidota bacterium]
MIYIEFMIIQKAYKILLVTLVLALYQNNLMACSMYKITATGKTMVGCNHDTWLTTPKIWFEKAKQNNGYGSVFTGSRQVSANRTTPQSGMNTAGLVFSRLSSYYPKQSNRFTARRKITNEADYLSEILHRCATVKEVKKYIQQYNHSFFLNDVFIYIDSLGAYLIVEPYKLIEGNNPNYVLANFCPSITNNEQARKLERYRNGADFLKSHKVSSSLDFSTSLADTMAVCRSRNGDGTLITSIFDTKEKVVGIYFYHNFDSLVQFNLTDELSKGDHILNIAEIFPWNPEFERLINFKTPSNTPVLRLLLGLFAGLLALISVALLLLQIQKNKRTPLSFKSVLVLVSLNFILIAYIVVLNTNNSIFYFDVPYQHYNSRLISASSYTPFLLLGLFLPLVIYTRNSLKAKKPKMWLRTTLVLNYAVHLMLLLSFGYWGLFNFWN